MHNLKLNLIPGELFDELQLAEIECFANRISLARDELISFARRQHRARNGRRLNPSERVGVSVAGIGSGGLSCH